MNISLRKANAIQASINDLIKRTELDTEVKLNEFQSPETLVQDANVAFLQALSRKEALYSALYEIRKAVSRANAQNSVDQLLAEVAHLDKVIGIYSELASKKPRESMDVVKGRLDKMRNAKEDHSYLYGRHNEITTSILEKLDLEAFARKVAEFKRNKQQLQDRLLEINVRTEITLDAMTEATLSTTGLL